MKIKQTKDSEKLIKKTKTIDDIFSSSNIDDNIDKSTNPKLISLKYDIETVLSNELKDILFKIIFLLDQIQKL
jgi:hypothetical protein